MKIFEIENEQLLVAIAPEYGARVVSLIDKGTGREWMAQGGFSHNTGEDAAYLGAEAVGWDECFPTVAPWDASGTAWGRHLRDHGDIWGRPTEVLERGPDEVLTRTAHRQFSFERRLRLDGSRLVVGYRLDNLDNAALPYLWALHALLAVTENDRIQIGAVQSASATYFSRHGQSHSVPSLQWPGPNANWPELLDHVQPVDLQSAVKLYASGLPGGSATVGHGQEWLRIDWDSGISDLGIWLNFGGWPSPGRIHQIALEPTSAPADHLGQALQRANPATLTPGGSHSWTVTFTVGANN
jgi:galactose mutarotase-like enzyme